EWVEQHAGELAHAVAYFNTDVAVSGPSFSASAVPSLQQFVREVTKEVPSPAGGTVYDRWRSDKADQEQLSGRGKKSSIEGQEVKVGELGSGSDYSPFFQHVGVPSTDIGSDGPYGVYHSVFDNYNWFVKFGDPTFAYIQQQARVFGLEVLHMADADILPYDYALYGQEVVGYLDSAQNRAKKAKLTLDFSPAQEAAKRFATAGVAIRAVQANPPANTAALNQALREAEEAMLNPAGLPKRSWYKHLIYAPGEFTGYAAVVIPGVNEGIDSADARRTQAQLASLANALNRSANVLEAAAKAANARQTP
ncbi:MAG: transferrin receptor-like dimerization domain-containing protein, partial [Granulicella sp.]